MDDLISRQAAIDAIKASTSKYTGFMEMEMYTDDDAIEAIKGLPPAQAEIITCIDCIHYTPLGKDKAWGRCSVHSSPTENQRMCQSCDFCSWAERRTDG